GNQFAAFSSSDGSIWASLGTTTVTMATVVNIGMAVTSHTTSALTTATFDNVSVTGGAPPPPPPGLPSPWTDQDVGAVSAAGSASFSSGVFTIKGEGADIWGTADAFHIGTQAASAERQTLARVATLQNTNAL